MTGDGNSLDVSEHIELVDQDGVVATVRLICAGCGDEIDEMDVFEDQLENIPDTPIHDSVSCQKEAIRDV
jgi:hypothetical protein